MMEIFMFCRIEVQIYYVFMANNNHNINFIAVAIIADGVKVSKKTKTDSAEDSVKTRIAQLRTELTREEFKAVVTQPMKETITAGKSLLSLGQRFSNWLGSLMKSQ